MGNGYVAQCRCGARSDAFPTWGLAERWLVDHVGAEHPKRVNNLYIALDERRLTRHVPATGPLPQVRETAILSLALV